MISYDDVRSIALDLPGAFERESYGGQPSWRLRAPRTAVREWDARDD